MSSTALVGTTSLSEYARLARRHALTHPYGQGPVAVWDPTGRLRMARRIAQRFGLRFQLAQAHPGDGDAGPPAGSGPLAPADREGEPEARPDHLVVVVGSDPEYAEVARVFATYRRATFEPGPLPVGALAARVLALGARFVTVAGPPEAVRFGLLAALGAAVGPRVAVGVLCSPTAAGLSDLVLKNVLYPRIPADRDVLLAPLHPGARTATSGSLTSYLGEAAAASVVTGQHRPMRVLSIITHGREDYLKLGESMICGRDPDAAVDAAALPRALPACLQGHECVRPGRPRLDPAQTPAQVVFVNACLTMKFGTHLFGGAFTVSQRFLDGWAAVYIASPLLKAGSPMENLLLHHLLDAGRSIGEAVAAVNANLARVGLDAPALTVVGDVEAVYGRPGSAVAPRASVVHQGAESVVALDGELPAFAAVPLANPDLLREYRSGKLEVVPERAFGGKLPTYAALHDTGDALELYVCGPEAVPLAEPAMSRRLVVRPRRPWPAQLLLGTIRRYEALADFDLRLPSAKGILTELNGLLPRTTTRVSAARLDLTQTSDLDRSVVRFHRDFDRLDAELLEVLLKLTRTNSYHFVEAYRERFEVEDVTPDADPCPHCGEVVFVYRHRHVVRTELVRFTHSCPVCGALSDFDDGRVTLDLLGEPALTTAVPAAHTLRIANQGPDEVTLLVGADVSKGNKDGFRVQTSPGRVVVQPDSVAEVSLEVLAGAPEVDHAVLLRAYAVGRGHVSFAGRDLWLRPRPTVSPLPTRSTHV